MVSVGSCCAWITRDLSRSPGPKIPSESFRERVFFRKSLLYSFEVGGFV
jgi:hypothetical protein